MARFFDGTNGTRISLADNPAVNFGTGDFSLAFWIRTSQNPPGGTFPVPIHHEDESSSPRSGYGFFIDDTLNVLEFNVLSGGTEAISIGRDISDGNWHFIVGVKTATKIYLYIDGILENSTSHTLGSTDKAVAFEVGDKSNTANRELIGYIDEVTLWSKALSNEEVKSLFNRRLPWDNFLRLYWRLDEESGTSANDLTGRGLTGTHNGGVSHAPNAPITYGG